MTALSRPSACGKVRVGRRLASAEKARVTSDLLRCRRYGRSGICSTSSLAPCAVPRRPPITRFPAGSRCSEIDTAVNVCAVLRDSHRRVHLLRAQKRPRLRIESEEDPRDREEIRPDPLPRSVRRTAKRRRGGRALHGCAVAGERRQDASRRLPRQGKGYVPRADERVSRTRLTRRLRGRCGNGCDHHRQGEYCDRRDECSVFSSPCLLLTIVVTSRGSTRPG